MKKMMILVFTAIIMTLNYNVILATTATYFCCKGSTGKCHTTDGQIWHTGEYTPCGSTPCTKDKCEEKTVTDSDGIINSRIFVSHDGTEMNGTGYVNIQLFYDESVKSGDFHKNATTLEFTNFLDWLNYIQTNPTNP
jgi:hypothetical protein